MGVALMNNRNAEIQRQLIKSYSALMSTAMNLCNGMSNRRDTAEELLHDTVAKTLDYFSKGNHLPLEEMHFWMITVMKNTSRNQKKSARMRLEQKMLSDLEYDETDGDGGKGAQFSTSRSDKNAEKINVIEAENNYFPRSLSMQLTAETKLNMSECWDALGPEGKEIISLNLVGKDNLTTKQIAKLINKPLGTVCVLLNRYKVQLYNCLSSES